MMGKTVSPFILIIAALIVAGFAYAHWMETLVLEGEVSTGHFRLEWSCECWDNEPPRKDFAEASCKIEDNVLKIIIKGAYPCYEVTGIITITNRGTVPAAFKDYEVVSPNDVMYRFNKTTGLWDIYYCPVGAPPPPPLLMATLGLAFRGDFKQIDPGEMVSVRFVVHFTNPGLPEDWSGTFTIKLYFENWSPPPPG